MRNVILAGIAGAAALVLANCSEHEAASAPPQEKAVRGEIERAWQEFTETWRRGDARAAAAWYTEEALNVVPGFETRGRERIEDLFRGFLDATLVEEISFRAEEVEVRGDTAEELGTLTQRLRSRADDTTTSESLRYLAIWQRQPDRSWKLHRFLAWPPQE